MKALLSLLLVLLFLFSPSTEAGQCGQGVQVAGGCACYSGYTNQFCAVDELSSSGCTLTNVSPLTTESVAELLTSPPYTQVLANSFTFTLASPGRLNRYFESIMLAGNDSCSYPSSHFTHSFNNLGSQAYTCNDAYTGMFTIPEVSACGFLESSDADFTILSGSISVVVKDDLGMFRSTAISRTTSSSLSVELKFPSHYTVSSGNLTVVSPINVLAAVTYQEFDPMNDQLTLKITTSVQWPYFLSVPTLVFSPDSSYVVTGPTIVDTSCDPNSGDCLQETTVSFTNITAAGVCSITDQVFPFDWNYACRGDPKECPVNGINSIPQVDTHITTGELCSSLAVVSNLRGDLTSHSSNAFGPTTIAYLANSPVFVLATMTSDVNIQAVEVVQVIIHYGGNSYTIVSGGSPQSGFGALNYQTYTAGLSSNQVGFSFDATYAGDSAIFISLGENIFVFTVEIQVQITYITSFKRDVVVEGMTLSKDLVLDATRI